VKEKERKIEKSKNKKGVSKISLYPVLFQRCGHKWFPGK
jgi:hypothetical protein